jgi:hypothetical protein
MPNDTRNNFELPCYLDVGSKLFEENPEGTLDLTDPNTRDQSLIKHVIKEGDRIGFKPVRIWLLSHKSVLGPESSQAKSGGPTHDQEDFYGDGGGGRAINARNGENTGDNFYNEQTTKVFDGPFLVTAEYVPVSGAQVLSDFGLETEYNDLFHFMIDEAVKKLGRVPFNGDMIERFDGKMLEVVSSVESVINNWSWTFQEVKAINTNKDSRTFFRGQE